MKNPHEIKVRRGAIRWNWKLADRINSAANEVRYADKPADLTFPQSNLIELSMLIRDFKMEWLEKRLKLDPRDRGRWPHL